MNEQIASLSRKYPAIAELLYHQGDGRIRDYLGQVRHRTLPDILPGSVALRLCSTVQHTQGADYSYQHHAFPAVFHQPEDPIPLDAFGDIGRPASCPGFSG